MPLYYQIELRLREAIESGTYRPGDRLPTEKVLQERFGVSRVTVRTALRRLEEEGMISTQRGRGTFVTIQGDEGKRIERNTARLHSFEEDILGQGGEPRIEVLALERIPVPQRIGNLLDLNEGTEITRIRRVGWVGETPLWVESRYIHPSVDAALSTSGAGNTSISRVLESESGHLIDSSRLRITAATATKDQANSLGIRPGDPVLINEFVDYADGFPIEAARAVFRADRYAFSVETVSPNVDRRGQLSHSFLGADGPQSIIRQEVIV
jgi:GntR family transcriptional regulator